MELHIQHINKDFSFFQFILCSQNIFIRTGILNSHGIRYRIQPRPGRSGRLSGWPNKPFRAYYRILPHSQSDSTRRRPRPNLHRGYYSLRGCALLPPSKPVVHCLRGQQEHSVELVPAAGPHAATHSPRLYPCCGSQGEFVRNMSHIENKSQKLTPKHRL